MVKAVIIGFGNVGRALLLELLELREIRVVGLASSRGAVIIRNRGDLEEAVKLAKNKYKLDRHSSFKERVGAVELASETGAELAFIVIPPSYVSGEPNRSIYYGLLDNNVSIITADKTVLAREYTDIKSYARERSLFLGYRATVAAGTPVLDVARGLRGRSIERVRAVLNATTNYILSLIEQGLSFSEAVDKSIKEELAEPDPRIDTHGWDPAAKLVITVSELGYKVNLEEVERTPLETIGEDEVRKALREGYRVKYIAEAIIGDKKYVVKPLKIPLTSRLAGANGHINIVEFWLENERVVIEGPAGPAWRTAKVMVTDALEYIEKAKGT